jgi:hypothetical protein
MKLLKKNGKFRKGVTQRLTSDSMAEVSLALEGDEVRLSIGYASARQVEEGLESSQVFTAIDLREFARELLRAAEALDDIRSKG